VRPVLQAFFFERKRRGIMAKKILAAANNKEQKYFMEEEFKFLPDTIKEDLKRICVYMAEKLNCTFLVGLCREVKFITPPQLPSVNIS
jgi:hypothetical protein